MILQKHFPRSRQIPAVDEDDVAGRGVFSEKKKRKKAPRALPVALFIIINARKASAQGEGELSIWSVAVNTLRVRRKKGRGWGLRRRDFLRNITRNQPTTVKIRYTWRWPESMITRGPEPDQDDDVQFHEALPRVLLRRNGAK